MKLTERTDYMDVVGDTMTHKTIKITSQIPSIIVQFHQLWTVHLTASPLTAPGGLEYSLSVR